ncbi:LysR substrate-binding domain-containing protein [Pseudoxanthomonas wuyuanensis]|uniref:LysR family transcriptional regulator, glycine cleavage system transcriptional activator n=1 Tax=Pseudoxanthomonas wuyuanensis TaxID=1073196 RepID=A0A286CV14_9GAMM|nr:LysR substrate-binding domain-containing protein [Pseudoxanthomonas wuyuanensis]KAF1717353.1 LysR family transcriptional regulator [Pseudoxanthomonas wuyuanensis]SOD50247.1 LysR family transcriptional regulator, glycine cleavage system transcriptional activator [Pseudoxanthomonas wuyuanensis]
MKISHPDQARPRRQLPPLGSLRVFEAAARHLSFRRAADELAITPTAVSHQIRALEERLGVSLFKRQSRAVQLTRAGAMLFPVVRNALDDIAQTLDSLRPGHARPIVTLSVTRGFAARWLVPRLPGFAATGADIDLHLHASDEPADLHNHGADLAVRYGGGQYPGLSAEYLLSNEFVAVASPWLGPLTSAQLAHTSILAYDWRLQDERTPDWPRWFREAGLTMPKGIRLLQFSDEAHAIQAAIAGQGAVLANRVLVADELRDGTLQALPGPVLRGFDSHLVWPSARDADPALLRVRQWLKNEAAACQLRSPGPPTA